jgi:hypothetical protein
MNIKIDAKNSTQKMTTTLYGPQTHITLRYEGDTLHATVLGKGFFHAFVTYTQRGKAVIIGEERQQFIADMKCKKDFDVFQFTLTENQIPFTRHMHKLIELELLTTRLMHHMAAVPGCIASPLELDGECFQIANARGQSICIHYGGWQTAPVYLKGMDVTVFEADYDVELVEDDVFVIRFRLPEEYDEIKAVIDKAVKMVFGKE